MKYRENNTSAREFIQRARKDERLSSSVEIVTEVNTETNIDLVDRNIPGLLGYATFLS